MTTLLSDIMSETQVLCSVRYPLHTFVLVKYTIRPDAKIRQSIKEYIVDKMKELMDERAYRYMRFTVRSDGDDSWEVTKVEDYIDGDFQVVLDDKNI